MFVYSYLEQKLLELDDNKNIVNSYSVERGSNFTLPDGREFISEILCIVEKNDDGDIVDYEKVFVDVREYFVLNYFQVLSKYKNIGGE